MVVAGIVFPAGAIAAFIVIGVALAFMGDADRGPARRPARAQRERAFK